MNGEPDLVSGFPDDLDGFDSLSATRSPESLNTRETGSEDHMQSQSAADLPAWLFLGLPTYLGPEITALVYSSLLGLAHLLVVAQCQRQAYGLRWVGSARDEARPAMGGMGGRLERAYRNFLETFPLFIAAVAAVTISGQSDRVSAWGAGAYFLGRLIYVPLYAFGVPVVRGLVWNIPTLGILAMFATLIPGVG